jgi:hypothetical protein
VIGKRCDECAQNHWNLESGNGCIPCDCDVTGTYLNSTSCNLNDGQCFCLSNREGKKCNECIQGTWGTPDIGCQSELIYKIDIKILYIYV